MRSVSAEAAQEGLAWRPGPLVMRRPEERKTPSGDTSASHRFMESPSTAEESAWFPIHSSGPSQPNCRTPINACARKAGYPPVFFTSPASIGSDQKSNVSLDSCPSQPRTMSRAPEGDQDG